MVSREDIYLASGTTTIRIDGKYVLLGRGRCYILKDSFGIRPAKFNFEGILKQSEYHILNIRTSSWMRFHE